MIIVNADDWGRSRGETDRALSCHQEGRISSVSAMVFMEDSERAAAVARDSGVDFGLHLNLSQTYSGPNLSFGVASAQARVVHFMAASKYAVLLYHPGLKSAFRDVYVAQWDEIGRLYGKEPSHIDGHHHRHLCMNMLVDEVIPRGMRVRRNFSFARGEKGVINRVYRFLVDWYLGRRYRITDYFFALAACHEATRLQRVVRLAEVANVEVMTHPLKADEYKLLRGDRYRDAIATVRLGSYAQL